MTYLLDTNVCIAYLRGRNEKVLEKFQSHASEHLSICATVRAELVFGALKNQSTDARLEIVRDFLSPLMCHDFTESTADVAAEIRAKLGASGSTIGPNDVQIAATAIEHDLILVTHNVGEFGRVAGMRIEEWEA